MRVRAIALLLCCFVSSVVIAEDAQTNRWSIEKANRWYQQQPWPVGCNFLPSTAVNQLEMWQADSFDPETIDREFGWAAELGFNAMRVYLHDILWQQDAEGFVNRIDQYLGIAECHGIRTIFVIFDDCWNPSPKSGKQPEPTPHVHNSGWVQSPGKEILAQPEKYDQLKPYVQGLLQRFKNDSRILLWDLYNEPGNDNDMAYGEVELKDKPRYSLELLTKAFAWARQVNPSQPLTVCVFAGDYWSDPENRSLLNEFAFKHSDVVSFHYYGQIEHVANPVSALKATKRPILCTEYMARTNGCAFGDFLPYFKQQRIGAINWGFVAGKSQTIYPWESWEREFTKEPDIWFHDVLRANGKSYDAAEVELIKQTMSL